MLYAALYVSRAMRRQTEADLADLLLMSRKRNAERGLTGRLVYAARGNEVGTFVQWIEGDDWQVRGLLYGPILRDGRHALVGIPFEGPVAQRAFPSWTMGYERLDGERAVFREVERLAALAERTVPVRPHFDRQRPFRIDV
ncbi:MAG: BLUF domain-containing protein [Bacteroidota bacterium]